jgi:hypothetical protein
MEDLNALLPIPSWKHVYGRREILHGTSKYDRRLLSTNTCIAHTNLFHLSIYYSLYICLSFNFGLLTLNCFKLVKNYFILQNQAQPRPRNFSRNCKLLISRQPKKYPSKILNKDNFKRSNWEGKKRKLGGQN